jgi:GTP-binding protein YchF
MDYGVAPMKIGLVGLPGSGKTSVFGALTGIAAETGFASRPGRANLGAVKVPDSRVDALARVFQPRRVVYAEITFSDLGRAGGKGVDRAALVAMREVDALCQVLRAFPGPAGEPADPLGEIVELETETLLADLEIVEQRAARLAKDRSDPRELELMQRLQVQLEEGRSLRQLELSDEELRRIGGYNLLSLKPLLLVLNVPEAEVAAPLPEAAGRAAGERGLGVVQLSAMVEMEIAQMPEEEQPEFAQSLGLEEPARNRFIRAAFELIDLISMLTAGPDECRAWPIPRGTPAPRAAGKIHSDIERGFIRAEVVSWEDLVALGSESRCREAGKLRVEGKDYVIRDGDVVHFRFNV